VNLAALDLNLLVVLDALLADKSVSGAARRLNATQPAVSRALGRLRTWFGDPLLTRTRTGMAPTAMGLLLATEVRSVIERIQGFVDRRESFEPATAKRSFRLTMTDFPQQIVCGPLLAHLARHAPGIDSTCAPGRSIFLTRSSPERSTPSSRRRSPPSQAYEARSCCVMSWC
jgi:DNA-binding transcriptional LysR family regulator